MSERQAGVARRLPGVRGANAVSINFVAQETVAITRLAIGETVESSHTSIALPADDIWLARALSAVILQKNGRNCMFGNTSKASVITGRGVSTLKAG